MDTAGVRGARIAQPLCMMKTLRGLWEKGRAAYRVLAAHKYTTIAGTLAFFLITSIVPFLFWLTLLFGRDPAGSAVLELELFGWARDLLTFLRTNAEGASAGAGVLFLATTLWSSSGFFYHLRRSGEIVYDYARAKHGWKVRLSAVLITFGVLAYFAVAGGVLFAGVVVSRFLAPVLGYLTVYALLLVVGFFAAWILNAYVCPYRVSPADTVPGSVLTAVLWLAASAAFAVYLGFSNSEKLYGALSLVIVFVLWLYWMMICLTVGMVFNRRRLDGKGRAHKIL